MGWGTPGGISAAEGWARRLREQDPTFTALFILKFRKFDEKDAEVLFEALRGNNTLLELSSSHPCSPQQALHLSKALELNRTLVALTLAEGSLGDAAVEALCPGLRASCSLRRLELGGLTLSQPAAAHLASALAGGMLTQLSLHGKQLGSGAVAELAPVLTRLQALDLTNCNVGGPSANGDSAGAAEDPSKEALALSALVSTGVLTSLVLRGNPLGPAFCRQLAPGIGAAVCLRRLDLADTAAGPEGCAALAAQLQPAAATEALHLDVGGCGIRDAGFSALCGAVGRGTPLAALKVGGAALTAAGLTAALRPLASPSDVTVVLRELDLSGSHDCINDDSIAALGALSGLQKLSLFDTALSRGGITSLVQQLSQPSSTAEASGGGGNTTASFAGMTELDLCGNGLELVHVQPMLDVLQSGAAPALRVLMLGANPGTDKSEVFAPMVVPLAEARPGLDVAWRVSAASN